MLEKDNRLSDEAINIHHEAVGAVAPTTSSIILTTYNRERYLSTAIESVLAQTHRDFELLIWDDGSTDGSVDIARGYALRDSRVRVVAAHHQGLVKSLKAAFAETSGTYVGLLDSDDLLAPTALEETMATLEAHSEIGMVYTDYMDIGENGEIRGYGQRCRIPYSREGLLLNFMTFHFRLVRRSVLEQVGDFDESFPCAQDYDLCLRLSEITEVWHLEKPLYYYRVHPQNISHEQSMEQARCSYKAIKAALKRRGLADFLELKLRIRKIGKTVHSLVSLRPRKNRGRRLPRWVVQTLGALSVVAGVGVTPALAHDFCPDDCVTTDGFFCEIEGHSYCGGFGNGHGCYCHDPEPDTVAVRFTGATKCNALDSGFDGTTTTPDSPWLSVTKDQKAEVAQAEIEPAGQATAVRFENTDRQRASVVPDKATMSPQPLTVVGIKAGDTAGLVQPQVAGASFSTENLSVAVYDKRTVSVALHVITPKRRPGHPRKGCAKPKAKINKAQFVRQLNHIWDQAAIEFQVTKLNTKPIQVDFDLDNDCHLDPGGGGPITAEEQAIVAAVRDPRAAINVYYVPSLKPGSIFDSASAVTFPGERLTFIQAGHRNSRANITAHEIGHSLDLLQNVTDDATRLMYETGLESNPCFLNKEEWDKANAKAAMLSGQAPALAELQDPSALAESVAESVAELEAEDGQVRSEAFRKLAAMGDRGTVWTIASFLWNADAPASASPHVRYLPYRFLAAWALSQIVEHPPMYKDLAALYTEEDVQVWQAWWEAHAHEYP